MTSSRHTHLAMAAGFGLAFWLLPAGTSGGAVGGPLHVDAALFGYGADAVRRLRTADGAVRTTLPMTL